MTTWFSSDHHFGHRNIIGYCGRPYDTIEQMDQDLIDRHNAVVAPTDRFIHVGDLSLSWPAAEWASERMHGEKMLVPGNHDRCWPHSKGAEKARARYRELGWTVTGPQMTLEDEHGDVYLVAHLPYEQDERHGDRFAGLHPVNTWGLPLICGHVHQLWHTRGRQFNVGVDVNNFAPVSFETIARWQVRLSDAR